MNCKLNLLIISENYQIELLKKGGNRRLKNFFSEYDLPANKYSTVIADYYRKLVNYININDVINF